MVPIVSTFTSSQTSLKSQDLTGPLSHPLQLEGKWNNFLSLIPCIAIVNNSFFSSVLAMKYDGGVVIAADTLGSYGSLARFTEIERVLKVNETTVLGAGGDFADFQFLSDIIKQKQTFTYL